MNEILVVNKEKDMTSRDVVNILNKVFATKKIGHTGTLDPLATGVLVICIGRYTKLVSEITSLDKEYIAKIKLGIKTDTADITGKVIQRKDFDISKDRLLEVLNSFVGHIKQTPPKYSAIKVDGKKLYEYAREGKNVEIPTREVEIKSIELLDFKDDIIEFKTCVSKGTYIRSLIEDICERLDTVGTMLELTRTRQGKFKIDDSYTIDEIKNGNFKFENIESVLGYQVIALDDILYNKVINGSKIELDTNEEKVILKYNDEIVAIYQKDNDVYKPLVMIKTK